MRLRKMCCAVIAMVVAAGTSARLRAEEVGGKTEAQPKVIVGYILARQAVLDPATIAAGKMTRINYAFFRLRGNRIVEGSAHDAENLALLNGLKREHPALGVLISVGGGGAGSNGFSDMAITSAGRQEFVDSAAAMVEKYGLDGIDVDWEYPGYSNHGAKVRPEDKETYTLLLKELRLRLDAEGKRLGRRLYTSSATGGTTQWMAHTNMREASKWLDKVNLMCYDYYNPVEKNTGHLAPLYTNPADPKRVSTDDSVRMNLLAGVPPEKLVVGVPFYGLVWTGVGPENHGLWQPMTGGPAVRDPWPTYGEIAASMVGQPGFARYWDPIAQAPYLYNAATKTFVTYDDAESEAAKTKYVREKGLAGVMFWQYRGDPGNVLLDAIGAGLGWPVSAAK